MKVALHPEAAREIRALPAREREAMLNALEKLKELGDQLSHPHSSDVKGADRLRELRPRAGRSRWRAFYRRIGAEIVVTAIGPEATIDPRSFRRAVRNAEERLGEVERER
jgi:phage-related protein